MHAAFEITFLPLFRWEQLLPQLQETFLLRWRSVTDILRQTECCVGCHFQKELNIACCWAPFQSTIGTLTLSLSVLIPWTLCLVEMWRHVSFFQPWAAIQMVGNMKPHPKPGERLGEQSVSKGWWSEPKSQGLHHSQFIWPAHTGGFLSLRSWGKFAGY